MPRLPPREQPQDRELHVRVKWYSPEYVEGPMLLSEVLDQLQDIQDRTRRLVDDLLRRGFEPPLPRVDRDPNEIPF